MYFIKVRASCAMRSQTSAGPAKQSRFQRRGNGGAAWTHASLRAPPRERIEMVASGYIWHHQFAFTNMQSQLIGCWRDGDASPALTDDSEAQ